MCSDTPLMRLTRDQRQELVSELADQGMSTRAIAPIVGASVATVKRDVAPGSNEPSDSGPREITGRDSQRHPGGSSSAAYQNSYQINYQINYQKGGEDERWRTVHAPLA